MPSSATGGSFRHGDVLLLIPRGVTAKPGQLRLMRRSPQRSFARSWSSLLGLAVGGERGTALEEQGVRERMRVVAAQLPLVDVELLGQQTAGPARTPVPFEQGAGGDMVALLRFGECQEEPQSRKAPSASASGP